MVIEIEKNPKIVRICKFVKDFNIKAWKMNSLYIAKREEHKIIIYNDRFFSLDNDLAIELFEGCFVIYLSHENECVFNKIKPILNEMDEKIKVKVGFGDEPFY